MRFIGRPESEASPISLLVNGLPGQHAGHQAHGGAGVAAIERLERRLQLAAGAVDDQARFGIGLDECTPMAWSARMVQTQSSPGRKSGDDSRRRRPARRKGRRGEKGFCRRGR
jgi:hypothetical protein